MASGNGATTLLAVGVIGFAAYKLLGPGTGGRPGVGVGVGGKQALRTVIQKHADGQCWQDTQFSDGSWSYQGPVDPSLCASPGAPAGRAAGPNPPPAPGLTVAQQYNQMNPDSSWWQVNQWSDGSYTSSVIDPGQYAAYGIPQPNTSPTTAPISVTSNNFDVAAGNPTVDPNGSNNAVTYAPGDPSTAPGGVQFGPAPVYGQAGFNTPLTAITGALQGFWNFAVQSLQVGQTSAVGGQGGPRLQ